MRRLRTDKVNELSYAESSVLQDAVGLLALVVAIVSAWLSWPLRPGSTLHVFAMVVLAGSVVTFITSLRSQGFTLDKFEKRLTRWKAFRIAAFAIRTSEKHCRFDGCDFVGILPVPSHTLLLMQDRRARERLVTVESIDEARNLAREIAAFLEYGVIEPEGRKLVRAGPDDVDEPFIRRHLRAHGVALVTPPPARMVTKYTFADDWVMLKFPGVDADIVRIMAVVAVTCIVVGFFVLMACLSVNATSTTHSIVFAIMMVPPFATIALKSLWEDRIYLTVNPRKVRIARFRALLPKKVVELPADELIDVRIEERIEERMDRNQRRVDVVVPFMQLVFKDRMFEVGEEVPRAELEWIRDVVIRALAAQT